MLFKQEFDEAINQAAVAGGATYLNKEDRQIALGLAINWGMRLLLAYALECAGSMIHSDRKELAWVANLVERSLLPPVAPSGIEIDGSAPQNRELNQE